jgi:hypothetical protein
MSSKRKKRKVPMNPDSGMDDMDRGKAFATRGLREAIGTFVPMEEWGEVYASIGRAVSRGAKEDDAGKLQVCKKYPALTGPMEKALQKAGESEKRKKRKSPEARLRALDNAFVALPDVAPEPENTDTFITTDADGPLTPVPGGYNRGLGAYEETLGREGMIQRSDMGRAALKSVGLYHGGNGMFGVGNHEDRYLAYCLMADLANGIGPTDEAIFGLKAVAERSPEFRDVIYKAMKILINPEHERKFWMKYDF